MVLSGLGVRFKVAASLAAAFTVSAALPAAAHHSFAMFDRDTTRTLDGTVVDFEWVNPHGYLTLAVVGKKSGRVQNWRLEMGGVNMMSNEGFRRTSFKPGDKVTVTINPLRDGTTGGKLNAAFAPDGTLIGRHK